MFSFIPLMNREHAVRQTKTDRLLTIHQCCFTDSNLSLPVPCLPPHRTASCPRPVRPLQTSTLLSTSFALRKVPPLPGPSLHFGELLFTSQHKVQRLPIHACVSSSSPLIFPSDICVKFSILRALLDQSPLLAIGVQGQALCWSHCCVLRS